MKIMVGRLGGHKEFRAGLIWYICHHVSASLRIHHGVEK